MSGLFPIWPSDIDFLKSIFEFTSPNENGGESGLLPSPSDKASSTSEKISSLPAINTPFRPRPLDIKDGELYRKWKAKCARSSPDTIKAMIELRHIILSKAPSAEEFANTRSNIPLRYTVDGVSYAVYSGDSLRPFFPIIKRSLEWPLKVLEERLEQFSSQRLNAEVIKPPTVSVCIQRSKVYDHNVRSVQPDKIRGKLESAARFAQSTLNCWPNLTIKKITTGRILHTINPEAKHPLSSCDLASTIPGEVLASIVETIGTRDSMEDTSIATLIILEDKVEGGEVVIPLFGVFDGHGGSSCANFLRDNIIKYIQDHFKAFHTVPPTIEENFNFLKKIFVLMGREYREKTSCHNNTGSTATIALKSNNIWYIACCGDSRAIRVKNGKAIALSVDANPDNKRDENQLFWRDVAKRGGLVEQAWGNNWAHSPRVQLDPQTGVNMTRAVGHSEMTGINPRAKVIAFKNDNIVKNDLLIIASDGLWFDVNSEQTAKIVSKLVMKGFSCKQIAEALIKIALKSGSRDNITVLVVDLSKLA